MKLSFYGGAMSVTGANYLLDIGSAKVLVDCGLYQGFKYAEELNYGDFGYNPAEIDFVFLTHSHTDHIGRLPKLYKEGFRGKIYTTEPTKDLIVRALPDNWRLMTEEARADDHKPLYEIEDIEAVLKLIETVQYHKEIKLISPNLSARFLNAGHILGSAIIEIQCQNKKIVFTGDLGNSPSLLLPDKEFVNNVDFAVIESAYGNRVHENVEEKGKILRKVIKFVIEKRGTLMIPSFAIERTQEILFEINKLLQAKAIPRMSVFIDSPLAMKMTEAYVKHKSYLNEEARNFISAGKNIFDFPGLRYTVTTDQSKSINDAPSPKIIIAGSGMSNGGRILHHERRYLSDPNSAIVFVGFQVEGSLGRRILDSADGVGVSSVNIFGDSIPINCLVKGIGGYSAHADQLALVDWTRRAFEQKKPLGKVFVVQGEETSAKALAEAVKSQVGIEAIVPSPGEEFEL